MAVHWHRNTSFENYYSCCLIDNHYGSCLLHIDVYDDNSDHTRYVTEINDDYTTQVSITKERFEWLLEHPEEVYMEMIL